MFTGIVKTKAIIKEITTRNNFARIVVNTSSEYIEQLEVGASVAINGVCLTAVEFGFNDSAFIAFDVIDETLKLTNLGQQVVGSKVNLERSLKMGDELGGHIVSGHVHTNVALIKKEQTPENCALVFELEANVEKYVLAKGFITVNGVSLTVGFVENNSFSVHLIPETLSRTNLGMIKVGDKVNLEFDQQTITIVKTIERMKLALK